MVTSGLQQISYELIWFNVHYQFGNNTNTANANRLTNRAKKVHYFLTNFHFSSISFTTIKVAFYHYNTNVGPTISKRHLTKISNPDGWRLKKDSAFSRPSRGRPTRNIKRECSRSKNPRTSETFPKSEFEAKARPHGFGQSIFIDGQDLEPRLSLFHRLSCSLYPIP